MLKMISFAMRQIVIASLCIIILREEILKLKESLRTLTKIVGYPLPLLDEQLIKLEIKKESYKNFIVRRIKAFSKNSASFEFKEDEFLPFTMEELQQGYAYLGKDGTHIILFRNGTIMPVSGNFKTYDKESSAIEFFKIKPPYLRQVFSEK